MGKATLMYVIGLAMIVSYTLLNVTGSATDAVSNSVEYYGRTVAHNIAVAGANVGTQLLLSGSVTSQTMTGSFQGGNYALRYDSLNADGDKRLTVVSAANVNEKFGGSILRDTVIATFKYTQFAKYGYFSGVEQNGYMTPTSNSTSGGNMWKVTGDSMFGYAHTNSQWHLGGRPYFHDKITGFNAPQLMVYGGEMDPIYNAGSQWGVTVNRPPANMTKLENIAASSTPPALFSGQDVALTFFGDGRVNVRIPATTGSSRNDTVAIGSLTSSGVVAVKDGDVRVKGVYSGQVTVVALKKNAAATNGNIWIDGDIVANNNPWNNPSSTDMLGLVAERMAYLTTTGIPRTPASITNIQAAIYAHLGVFAVENYSTTPVGGRINLFGALSMNASTSTGRISGGSLVNGMLKSIRHDPRFDSKAPPSFPVSDKYELVSWWEK
ncbi:MAG: hypothetical protein OEM41_03315 [Ignavibacteria bacterium]|nr:hypothetical protein [Ignavibacteria bacterium]